MKQAAITIQHFSSVYCCTPMQDAGQRLRERLDAVLRGSIARHIDALCASLLSKDDEAVWLVRRLEIDFAINSAWDDERIAFAWAKAMVSALGAELAAGGGEHALRFENEAAYLARFFTDLASGDAWSKWYYRRFAGLAALPSSSAIRSVLMEAKSTGVAALRALSEAEVDRVLDTLSRDDALLVLNMCTCLADAHSFEESAVLAAPHARLARRYAPADPRWALEVFIAANKETGSGGAVLLAAISALAASMLSPQVAGGALNTMPQWIESLGGLEAQVRLPQRLSATLPHTRPAEMQETRHTHFGGGFVLLPLLFDLPWRKWMLGWPELAGLQPAPVLRALLLAKCLGAARCMQFLRDPLWVELLGLPMDMDWHESTRALAHLGSPVRRALRSVLEEQAQDYGGMPDRNRVARAGRRTWRVFQDEAGYWHRLVPEREQGELAEADPDLAYLARPPGLRHGMAWDGLLSLASQQLLRRFARRLPGFGLSHCEYLYRNFLAMSARVEREGERYVVCLSRPPLALMLNLTGMTRTEYELPWQPGRYCMLYTE